jgi:hypothetical protein
VVIHTLHRLGIKVRFGRSPHSSELEFRRLFRDNYLLHHPPLIMTSEISNYFLSAPPTSQLEAPEEIQRVGDFESTRTEPIEEEEITDPGLELSQLTGYELSRDLKKLRSFIWTHGWRLINDEGMEHWICRKCHTGPLKPKKPNGHLFKTTTQTSGRSTTYATYTALYHQELRQYVHVGPSATPSGSRQASITGFTAPSTGARNSDGSFDYDVFKGLLLQLFTTRSLPFALIDDEAFRSLLIYCQPLLNDCIPSRRTLRRYIEVTYNQCLTMVESHLKAATTKINLSFDL